MNRWRQRTLNFLLLLLLGVSLYLAWLRWNPRFLWERAAPLMPDAAPQSSDGDIGIDALPPSRNDTFISIEDELSTTRDPSIVKAVPFYGYCPNDGPSIDRPHLSDIVNLRLDELHNRTRELNRNQKGSQALRSGLRALQFTNPRLMEDLEELRRAPDRRDNGFDYLVAVELTRCVRASIKGDDNEALRWAELAIQDGPLDPAPWIMKSLVARARQDSTGELVAFREAFKRDPEEPAIALVLGRLLAHTADLSGALRALDAYLISFPEDSAVAGLRARIHIREELQRDFNRSENSGITLLWSPEVSDELAAEIQWTVVDALGRAAQLLGTERRSTLTVTVYAARSDLQAVTCVQGWARAVFDGSLHLDGERLSDPAQLKMHIEHESLHAQLSAVAPGAPVWFHEGLAQYFAQQLTEAHIRSYRFMVANETWIPFSSLDGSFQVISDSGDAGRAYHQSRAMVELLIHRGGQSNIHRAVSFLRQGGEPARLLDHLGGRRPLSGQELLEYLETVLEDTVFEELQYR